MTIHSEPGHKMARITVLSDTIPTASFGHELPFPRSITFGWSVASWS